MKRKVPESLEIIIDPNNFKRDVDYKIKEFWKSFYN